MIYFLYKPVKPCGALLTSRRNSNNVLITDTINFLCFFLVASSLNALQKMIVQTKQYLFWIMTLHK